MAAQGPITKRDEGRDTDHWSVYGVLEYDFNDRLTGSVEARYSDESTDTLLDRGRKRHDRSGLCGTDPGQQQPDRVSGDSEDSFFTPRFTLEYQYSDETF